MRRGGVDRGEGRGGLEKGDGLVWRGLLRGEGIAKGS